MTVISTFPMAVTASQLVFLFLLVGPETGKTATTVSLSGKVSHIIFKEPDKPQVLRTRRFTAEIGSNVWRITTEVTAKPLSKRASEISVEGLSFSNPQKKVHSGTDGSALSCEYVYDGTFSFQRVVRDYDQDEVHQRKAKEPGYRGHVSEQLIIGERVYPDFNTDLCMPVWLAYASDHYAQQQGGFWPELIWMGTSNLDPGSRAFRVDYRRRCSDSICVPEEIVFFNQGFSPGADKRGHLVGKPQPPNLRPSFLEAKYTVSSWREVSSRLYPAKSAIEYYAPPADQQEVGRVTMRVEITTEDVVVSTAVVSTKPSINRDTITRVVDYRLMTSSGPVSYITTNDLIEPDSATAQTLKTQFEQFEEDKRKRPSARSQQRAKRVFLFLLFGAVTVGPLVIWGVLRGRTQQNA